MHVVFFGDQHAESSGGAQVSMRLQRRFLERAGHTVTIVAPRTRAAHPGDPAYLDLPSVPVTLDGEYALSVPGRRTDRWLDAALAGRPRVDLVHVQADFWGAMIGHRFAARHGLPVVHTMHNRVDVGIRATTPAPGLVLRLLNAWARRQLRGVPPRDGRGIASPSHDSAGAVRHPYDPATAERDGWAYLRRFAARADAVTAPSSHFARRLREHGCGVVDVVWNGIDDGLLDAAITAPPSERTRPRLVWIGRMSPEKRLLPFLEAVAESGIDAEVEVIGGGGQLRAAQRLVARLRPSASVVFPGRLPYAETLARIASADAVVQTSIGFETQGMTVFEAAALGTPAVVSDPDIADELGAGVWRTADGSVPALAATLRQAVAEIGSGTAPVPDPSVASRFRQSSRTAAMVALYDEVLARR